MSKKVYFSLVVLLLAAFAVTGCGGNAMAARLAESLSTNQASSAVLAQATNAPSQNTSSSSEPASPGNVLLDAYQGTLQDIYTRVNPSVVNIQVVDKKQMSDQSSLLPFFNFPGLDELPSDKGSGETYSRGEGSGFVWDTEGHIVTNFHVVDGADKIQVIFPDGTIELATVVGGDSNSDLAVLKVDVASEKLQPVTLADSDSVKVGQLAIAIGNPFGLQGTMTAGIISAKGRSLPATSSEQGSTSYSIPDVIQTDAPINPGNSGGVLVDAKGDVIGVTAAIQSTAGSNAGVGFVIPSAIVKKVVPGLIKDGSYQHAWLGISGISLRPDLAKEMDLSEDQRGALVEEVMSDSPADKAGFRGSDRKVTIDGQDINVGGDVIIAVNGQEIRDIDELVAYLYNKTNVGDKVKFTLLRDGKEITLDVELAARPGDKTTAKTTSSETKSGQAWLGIVGADLNSDIAKAMRIDEKKKGVLIMQVEANGPADKADLRGGFKPLTVQGQQTMIGGDVILAVDGKDVKSLDELRNILADYQPGDTVKLTILRENKEMEVEVKLEARP